MSPNVSLSDVVKARLEKYRDDLGHSSMDSALREIMMKADVEIDPNELDLPDNDSETDESGGEDDGNVWGEEWG